jgi:hypothetical protein
MHCSESPSHCFSSWSLRAVSSRLPPRLHIKRAPRKLLASVLGLHRGYTTGVESRGTLSDLVHFLMPSHTYAGCRMRWFTQMVWRNHSSSFWCKIPGMKSVPKMCSHLGFGAVVSNPCQSSTRAYQGTHPCYPCYNAVQRWGTHPCV